MQYKKQYINSEINFLEVIVNDEDDYKDLFKYQNETNIIISMSDIQYLTRFNRVEQLIITSGEAPENISRILEMLQHLKVLKLDYYESELYSKWCIDLSNLRKLELLFSRSSNNFHGIANSNSLKTLIVNNWQQYDLSQLEGASIDSLIIGCGNLRNLNGIEQLPIKILSLANLRNLTDISSISKTPLKILEIEKCNNITNLHELTSSTLEYLMIYSNITLPNLSFISNFCKLKRVMLDISIENGDLSVLDGMESAVILKDHKSFNRKNSQLPKSSQKYQISSIPQWRYFYIDRKI